MVNHVLVFGEQMVALFPTGITLLALSQMFGIVSAASVIVTVPVAIVSLLRVVQQRRSESLLRVIGELRDDEFRALARTVYTHFPVPRERDLPERLVSYIQDRHELSEEAIDSAIQLVNRLNNIAALIEQGAVRERDLHGQTHPRVIELATRLDAFILVRSAELGYRWGMRVRRLGLGASNYYRTSPLHRDHALKCSGIILVDSNAGWNWWFTTAFLRARVLGQYMPSAKRSRRDDVLAISAAKSTLANISDHNHNHNHEPSMRIKFSIAGLTWARRSIAWRRKR